MYSDLSGLNLSHFSVTGIEMEINKINEDVKRWKERLDQLKNKESRSETGDYFARLRSRETKDLEISELEHLINQSYYEKHRYEVEKQMLIAISSLRKGEISKTEFNRRMRHLKKSKAHCTEMLEASNVAENIYGSWNPNNYEGLLDAYKLDMFIMEMQRMKSRSQLSANSAETKQLEDIFELVNSCTDIFNKIIYAAKESKQKEIKKAANFATRNKDTNLAKTIGKSELYIDIRDQLAHLYHLNGNPMREKAEVFSSTEEGYRIDTFPSKHQYDEIKQRASQDKYDREKLKYSYEALLRNNDIIDAILKLLPNLPNQFYSQALRVIINFTEYNNAINNLKNKLLQIKKQNLEKLKGFTELQEKYKKQDKITAYTNILADMYKTGKSKEEIDAFKERIIAEFGKAQEVNIDSHARAMVSSAKMAKSLDKFEKIGEERREEERRKFVAKDHIIPAADLERMKSSAQAEADREYPHDVYLGGEYRDDPRKEGKYQDSLDRRKEKFLNGKFVDISEQRRKTEEEEKQRQQEEAEKEEKEKIQQSLL
jgi:hypothetical protein